MLGVHVIAFVGSAREYAASFVTPASSLNVPALLAALHYFHWTHEAHTVSIHAQGLDILDSLLCFAKWWWGPDYCYCSAHEGLLSHRQGLCDPQGANWVFPAKSLPANKYLLPLHQNSCSSRWLSRLIGSSRILLGRWPAAVVCPMQRISIVAHCSQHGW